LQEIYPTVLFGRILVAGGFTPIQGGLAVSDRLFSLEHELDPPFFRPREEDTIFLPGCGGSLEWRDGAKLPEPRHHPNLVSLGNHAYALGGFTPSTEGNWKMLSTVSRYNPPAFWHSPRSPHEPASAALPAAELVDSWSEMASMPAPFGETVATALGENIHIATGRQLRGSRNADWRDHADSGAHYIYDVSEDRWRTAAPNPHPRNSAAGAVLTGNWHIIGGRTVNGGNASHHEAYDAVSDRWEERAPLPQAQGGLAAGRFGDRIIAFGGEYFGGRSQRGGVYPNTWEYNPLSDAWAAVDDMNIPRHGLGAVQWGDNVLSIGGATAAGGNQTSVAIENYGSHLSHADVRNLEPDSQTPE
jgi:hypothetical protein